MNINNNPNIDKPFARNIPFEPVVSIAETNVQKAIEAVSGASAPGDAQYYVAAADSDLDNEIVVPAFIQTLLDDTSQGEAQTTLGLVPGTDVQAYSANLDLWSAETPADYALLATLASTANGNGASLIGIEDSGTLITATTVEGALAENRTAIDAIEADYLTSSDIGVTVQAYAANLDTWSGLAPSANFQTLIPQTFAQMRASLDLEAGIDFYSIAGADAAFQPLDTDLTAIAALTTTSFGRAFLEFANEAAFKTGVNLEIGVDVQAFDADTLKADTPDTLTAGFAHTPDNDGTQSSGTYTPDQDGGNMKRIVNGGAFTLAPPTDNCCIILQITNNASAGAITTSGFSGVFGDSFTTTNGDDFICTIIKINGFSSLTVQDVS